MVQYNRGMQTPRVAFGYSDAFRAHVMDADHPERPSRVDAARRGAARLGERVRPYPFGPASREALERVHHPRFVESVAQTARASAPVVFDEDTIAGPHTWDTAILAAGAAIGAVDAVMTGAATRAFSLARPPGHHAEVDRAMGYCFFNNVAIAAEHAREVHGARRVAIVDWDVHHGNGTERAFASRRDVLFVSSHQPKLFPVATGHHEERGRGDGRGFTINLPLPTDATDEDLFHFHRRITAPVLTAFAPDLILISAGFDAHERDRTSGQHITARGFARLAALLFGVADRVCEGRVALVLEGGYDTLGIEESVAAVLEAALATDARGEAPIAPSPLLAARLDAIVALHAPAWPVLVDAR